MKIAVGDKVTLTGPFMPVGCNAKTQFEVVQSLKAIVRLEYSVKLPNVSDGGLDSKPSVFSFWRNKSMVKIARGVKEQRSLLI